MAKDSFLYSEFHQKLLDNLYGELIEKDVLGKIKKCYDYFGQEIPKNLEKFPEEELEEIKKVAEFLYFAKVTED